MKHVLLMPIRNINTHKTQMKKKLMYVMPWLESSTFGSHRQACYQLSHAKSSVYTTNKSKLRIPYVWSGLIRIHLIQKLWYYGTSNANIQEEL
jgi:hypothetical protein